ncbi:Rad52/Rad22 family DNA repair protein [Rhodococcoides fascians]|uniref:Rad52/Rad22 family DNA repair protein n=1 Tax=Rhodococcoides fascians TaxID=1828 RepID=UPI00068CD9C0|nr:Rad52/Rad22 family DNA repair protein [Rhodococcus fascians]
MANFTSAQTKQLLSPINPVRVMKDGKGNAHLPQQDVLAHLNRIFGFGAFDYEMLSDDMVFEQQHTKRDGTKPEGRFDVCYRVTMRLTVRNSSGDLVCRFEDGSTGSSSNQSRADGHDLAFKSAISLAKKRCAIALGDQFGLSLYNKGQLAALVGGTLVMPGEDDVEKDIQENVPESKSMGHDEVERPLNGDDEPTASTPAREAAPKRQGGVASLSEKMSEQSQAQAPAVNDDDVVEKLTAQIEAATDRETLLGLYSTAQNTLTGANAQTLMSLAKARAADLGVVQAA